MYGSIAARGRVVGRGETLIDGYEFFFFFFCSVGNVLKPDINGSCSM